jgi:hypothetical protein
VIRADSGTEVADFDGHTRWQMTIEQLIEEELSTDRRTDPAARPIGVSFDEQTGEFELDSLAEDGSTDPEKALLSFIH